MTINPKNNGRAPQVVNTLVEQVSALQEDLTNLTYDVRSVETEIANHEDAVEKELDTKKLKVSEKAVIEAAEVKSIDTDVIDATEAHIPTLIAQNAAVENLTVTNNISAANVTSSTSVFAPTITTNDITVNHEIIATNVSLGESISAPLVDADDVNTVNVNATDVNTTKITTADINATGKIKVKDLEITGSITGLDNIENASIENITAEAIEANSGAIDGIFISDNNRYTPTPALGPLDTYTIELPTFTGTYLIKWVYGANTVWSATVIGNGEDYTVYWNTNEKDKIKVTHFFQYNHKFFIRIKANGDLMYGYHTTEEVGSPSVYYNLVKYEGDKSLEELCDKNHQYQCIIFDGQLNFGPFLVPEYTIDLDTLECTTVKAETVTAKTVDADNINKALASKIPTSYIGTSNGVASLDSTGHIPADQLPTDALVYKGQWDASTGNYPPDGTSSGQFYIISVAGTIGGTSFHVGDWIIWNGSTWDKRTSSNTVISVNGKEGVVVLNASDVGAQATLVSGTNIKTINNTSILGSGNLSVVTDVSGKMDKTNPTGTGSFSLNRQAETKTGTNSFAEGYNGIASGNYSHAENNSTTASGESSHAEGSFTTAKGLASHTEGDSTQTLAAYAHAEGLNTKSSGEASHAEGRGTTAAGINSHVQGKYNIEDTANKFADIIGGGSSTASKNIEATDWSGNKYLKGDVYVGCEDDSTGGTKLITTTDLATKQDKITGGTSGQVWTSNGTSAPGWKSLPAEKVSSVNTKTGAVVLKGSDIAVSASNTDTIDTALGKKQDTISGGTSGQVWTSNGTSAPGWKTLPEAPVKSVNNKTGTVVLTSDLIKMSDTNTRTVYSEIISKQDKFTGGVSGQVWTALGNTNYGWQDPVAASLPVGMVVELDENMNPNDYFVGVWVEL